MLLWHRDEFWEREVVRGESSFRRNARRAHQAFRPVWRDQHLLSAPTVCLRHPERRGCSRQVATFVTRVTPSSQSLSRFDLIETMFTQGHTASGWQRVPREAPGGGGVPGSSTELHQSVCGQHQCHVFSWRPAWAFLHLWEGFGLWQSQRWVTFFFIFQICGIGSFTWKELECLALWHLNMHTTSKNGEELLSDKSCRILSTVKIQVQSIYINIFFHTP